MFRHLLVPLDGSHLAESALPAAAELAKRLGARVTLLHAVEREAPTAVHGERHLTQVAEAEAYLREVATWVASHGVPTEVHLAREVDDVAGSIAAEGAELRADLIVLCTHGGGGLRGLLFGRVAQLVLQRGTIPVFLVQPSAAGRDQPFARQRILVPLDGSETAEIALPAAAEVARAWRATVVLTWVVPTVVTMSGERAAAALLMPTAAAAMLDDEAEQAKTYLGQIGARLSAQGVSTSMVVVRGDPVREVLDAVVTHAVDLIVIATHGRSGVDAVWAGSVASRIVAASTRPILLIRIPTSIRTPEAP